MRPIKYANCAEVKLLNRSWIDFLLEQIVRMEMLYRLKIYFDNLSTEMDQYVKPAGGAAGAAGSAGSGQLQSAGVSKRLEAQLLHRRSDAAPQRLQGHSTLGPVYFLAADWSFPLFCISLDLFSLSNL